MRLRILISAVTIAVTILVFALSIAASAEDSTVTARVDVVSEGTTRNHRSKANVVVSLTSLDGAGSTLRSASEAVPVQPPRLVQKGKRFDPHLLVVPVGTAVEFPNRDPFFHNVFSLFEGKSFDLGLYEAGTSRLVHFDRAGVSYIFCNIHPEMSAVVIAMKTPYYAVSNGEGKIVIEHVPQGRYLLQVWAEGASPDNLKSLNREVMIASVDHSLGTIRVVEDSPLGPHKNMYGRDYDAPGSDYPRTDPR